MTQINTLRGKGKMSLLCTALLGFVIAAGPVLGAETGSTPPVAGHDHSAQDFAIPATLVQIVRDATKQFLDVNATNGTDYAPLFGCVTGPEQGAMGVHFISLPLVGDGEIDGNHPEALIYEPSRTGYRLVGVEYIVDSATWLASHDSPPMLEGQAFQFVSSPNRYGLPSFFELHVWAWRDNPNGAFVDWNTRVSCEGQ